MKEEYFQNTKELYDRLLPALKSKNDELKRNKIMCSEKEIFRCLYEIKWSKSYKLTLFDMVDDILNTNNLEILENIRKDTNG